MTIGIKFDNNEISIVNTEEPIFEWSTERLFMKLVILESPYANSNGCSVEDNVKYAQMCLRDSLMRGEAPIASHLLYTQPFVLDDNKPEERAMGISAGLAWREVAHGTVVYEDLGITEGMKYGIAKAEKAGLTIEYRNIL